MTTKEKAILVLTSKEADITLERDSPLYPNDWSVWFLDQPKEGQCLSIEYIDNNWPAMTISITSNEVAKEEVAQALLHCGFKKVENF